MSAWTIVKSGGRFWVYRDAQPRKDFATHKQAMNWLKAERRAEQESPQP